MLGFLSFNLYSLIRKQQNFKNFKIQLTVTGLTGRTGATVLSRVEAEYRIDQGRVPTPHRLLEGSCVLGMVTKLVHVTNSLAQVNTYLV